jgi:DNA-binding NarL/FixJ family response regulator
VSPAPGAAEPLAVPHWPVMRLVIAMAHTRLGDTIVRALTSSDSVAVVGRAGDLDDAVRVTRETRPDGVVVGALLLPGDVVNGLRRLAAAIPGVRIVVIGTETSPAYAAAIKGAGAADYVALDGGPDSVVQAVRQAIPAEPSQSDPDEVR